MPGLAAPGTPAPSALGVLNARADGVGGARRAWGRPAENGLREMVGWILVHNDCDAVGLRLARVMVMVIGCDAGAGCPRHPRPECAGSF